MNAVGLLLLLLAMQMPRSSSRVTRTNSGLNNETDKGTALTEEEFASALLLTQELYEAAENANLTGMYSADLFEGDIDIPGLNAQNIRSFVGSASTESQGGVFRNGLRSHLQLWPGGRVPYTLSNDFPPISRLVFAAAIAEFNAKTCVRFVPKEASDVDYVALIDSGCSSSVGRDGRADRDEYVKVNLQNVLPILRGNFEKYSLEMITHLNTSYDYDSLLHYPSHAFSMNGLPTIVPLKAGVIIGFKSGFSDNDIVKINRLYNCDATATTTARPKPFRPCQDKLSNCGFLNKVGHCRLNHYKQFMQSNCPVSCNYCRDDGSAPCVNEMSACGAWAASLSCAVPQLMQYMYSKCPSACGLC